MTRPAGMDEPRPGAPIKVLLADDQELVRAGFKVLLDTEDDITVVGEAATAPKRWRLPAPPDPMWC